MGYGRAVYLFCIIMTVGQMFSVAGGDRMKCACCSPVRLFLIDLFSCSFIICIGFPVDFSADVRVWGKFIVVLGGLAYRFQCGSSCRRHGNPHTPVLVAEFRLWVWGRFRFSLVAGRGVLHSLGLSIHCSNHYR